ncbi:MAG TPA: hypothetical protein ENK94_03435 [Campylobacterales bacterium]|nr:hypothetical protein [Campylobacterales bacterium]
MKIKLAKWKDAKQAPVIFMIDDIANVLMKKSFSSSLKIGEDWGHAAMDKNSMWDFLSKRLLTHFPEIKVTFFLVTGKRVSMREDESHTYAKRMDEDQKFINFLHYLDKHPQVELAYHGTTHGEAGQSYEDFRQEWETFNTLEEAIARTNEGIELFKTVLGHYPSGGKYCGYKAGKFGDESIAKTGFKWWSYGEDYLKWDKDDSNPTYSFDLSMNQGVVNIPTTLDSSTLSLKITNKWYKRKYLKSLYYYLFRNKTIEKHLESLYNNQEVISIYEHTSPYRSDKVIQYPNIVSDIDNLYYLFSLLSHKDVWYATGEEVANYYLSRENATLKVENSTITLNANENFESPLSLVITDTNTSYALYDMEKTLLTKAIEKSGKQIITYPFVANQRYQILNKSQT